MQKLSDESLDYLIKCAEATKKGRLHFSPKNVLAIALELKQLRARTKYWYQSFDTGKPDVIGGGKNYSLSYADSKDVV